MDGVNQNFEGANFNYQIQCMVLLDIFIKLLINTV